jgi:transposase
MGRSVLSSTSMLPPGKSSLPPVESDVRKKTSCSISKPPSPRIRWHFVVDYLNIHLSESLVRYVAQVCGIEDDLGEKGKQGILHNKASRAAFLSGSSHTIVFHYTPKHCSWLNQVEIWFSILMRKVIRRGSFTSQEDLREKVLAFIAYFNQTMAKPFKWTYQGKVLTV